jgi:hypothetical protein
MTAEGPIVLEHLRDLSHAELCVMSHPAANGLSVSHSDAPEMDVNGSAAEQVGKVPSTRQCLAMHGHQKKHTEAILSPVTSDESPCLHEFKNVSTAVAAKLVRRPNSEALEEDAIFSADCNESKAEDISHVDVPCDGADCCARVKASSVDTPVPEDEAVGFTNGTSAMEDMLLQQIASMDEARPTSCAASNHSIRGSWI